MPNRANLGKCRGGSFRHIDALNWGETKLLHGARIDLAECAPHLAGIVAHVLFKFLAEFDGLGIFVTNNTIVVQLQKTTVTSRSEQGIDPSVVGARKI